MSLNPVDINLIIVYCVNYNYIVFYIYNQTSGLNHLFLVCQLLKAAFHLKFDSVLILIKLLTKQIFNKTNIYFYGTIKQYKT